MNKNLFEISTDTVPYAKYVIVQSYSLLNELHSTHPIHQKRIYLSSNNPKNIY